MATKNPAYKNVIAGLMVAMTAILSQVAIPMPSGVPITLQTFAAALCPFLIGTKRGTLAIGLYIAAGTIGLPVFHGFRGGFSVLTDVTGGFIYGFIFLALVCGLSRRVKNKFILVLTAVLAVLLCHVPGVLQFAALTNTPAAKAVLLISVPYIFKDIVSVLLAKWVSEVLLNRLNMQGN